MQEDLDIRDREKNIEQSLSQKLNFLFVPAQFATRGLVLTNEIKE